MQMLASIALLALSIPSCEASAEEKGAIVTIGGGTKSPIETFVSSNKTAKKIAAFSGTLEKPKVGIFAIKKGYCYFVRLTLGAGASEPVLSERNIIQMDWPNSAAEQMPGTFGAKVEFGADSIYKPDCATTRADVGVWVGLQRYEGIKPIGKGPFTIEVFERQGSAKELAAEAAADKKFHEDNRKEDAHRARTQSSGCLDQCLHSSTPDQACYPEAREGIITPGCAAHCKAKCRR